MIEKNLISEFLTKRIKLDGVKWYADEAMVIIFNNDDYTLSPKSFDNDLHNLFPYEYLEWGKHLDKIYRVYHLTEGSIRSDRSIYFNKIKQDF